MVYSELLPFAATERQREVLERLVANNNNLRATARELNVKHQSLATIVDSVKRNAAKRLYSPDHQLDVPLPEGYIGGFTMHVGEDGRRKNLWLKAKPDEAQKAQRFREFVEGLSKEIKPAKEIKPRKYAANKDLLASIVIGDGHMGMLAHKEDNLKEDFNLEIATRDLRDGVDYLIETAPPAEEGMLVNVGDFLHADDTKNETPGSGHTLDVAARHPHVLRMAGATLRYCIDQMARNFKTVRVVNAAGNHDPHSAVALSMYLEGVYEKNPRVIIEPTQSKFYFYEFGKNLIGITHGDRIPAARLAGVMTRLAAQEWGRTKFRRWWVGHIHHKQKNEMDAGCTIESFNTLAGTDAWHAASGYGGEQGIEMIVLHREYGEIGRIPASLEMVRAYR